MPLYRCQVDLADLELDVTHNLVLDLDVGVGHIHLQLCITGTANQQSCSANGSLLESQPSQEETNWEQITQKYVSCKRIVFVWIDVCCCGNQTIPTSFHSPHGSMSSGFPYHFPVLKCPLYQHLFVETNLSSTYHC